MESEDLDSHTLSTNSLQRFAYPYGEQACTLSCHKLQWNQVLNITEKCYILEVHIRAYPWKFKGTKDFSQKIQKLKPEGK